MLREELNDRGCVMLVANMIMQAFEDLYTESKTIEDANPKIKDKAQWLKDVNRTIEHNRATARAFFKSPLFIATGLDYNYLEKKYLEGEFKIKNNT